MIWWFWINAAYIYLYILNTHHCKKDHDVDKYTYLCRNDSCSYNIWFPEALVVRETCPLASGDTFHLRLAIPNLLASCFHFSLSIPWSGNIPGSYDTWQLLKLEAVFEALHAMSLLKFCHRIFCSVRSPDHHPCHRHIAAQVPSPRLLLSLPLIPVFC